MAPRPSHFRGSTTTPREHGSSCSQAALGEPRPAPVTTSNAVSTRAQAAQPSPLRNGTEPRAPSSVGTHVPACEARAVWHCHPGRRVQRRPANLGIYSSAAPFCHSCSEKFSVRPRRKPVSPSSVFAGLSLPQRRIVSTCAPPYAAQGTSRPFCRYPTFRNLPEVGPLVHLPPLSCRPRPPRPRPLARPDPPLRCVCAGPSSSSPCSPDAPPLLLKKVASLWPHFQTFYLSARPPHMTLLPTQNNWFLTSSIFSREDGDDSFSDSHLRSEFLPCALSSFSVRNNLSGKQGRPRTAVLCWSSGPPCAPSTAL